jgi:acylphosphatase
MAVTGARPALRIWVEGHVQGVGFRWWVSAQAGGLGLSGWVRNRADGRVEVLAIGDSEPLSRLVESCGRGPPGASVTDVRAEPAQDDGSQGFDEKPTL